MWLIVHCLNLLNNQTMRSVESPKHSNAAAIVFNIYDEELIPRAIHLLLTNSPSNDVDCDVKKVISTLCCWLRSSSGYVHLSKCIVDLLEGLRVSSWPSHNIWWSVHFTVGLSHLLIICPSPETIQIRPAIGHCQRSHWALVHRAGHPIYSAIRDARGCLYSNIGAEYARHFP